MPPTPIFLIPPLELESPKFDKCLKSNTWLITKFPIDTCTICTYMAIWSWLKIEISRNIGFYHLVDGRTFEKWQSLVHFLSDVTSLMILTICLSLLLTSFLIVILIIKMTSIEVTSRWWLLPSPRHLKNWQSLQMTVTSFGEVTVNSNDLPSACHFYWRHFYY